MGDIIQLNQAEIWGQLKDLVRVTVEETLNKRLDEEADRITNAHRYEQNEDRQDTRAGHCRSLTASRLYETLFLL